MTAKGANKSALNELRVDDCDIRTLNCVRCGQLSGLIFINEQYTTQSQRFESARSELEGEQRWTKFGNYRRWE